MNGCLPMLIFGLIGLCVLGPLGLIVGVIVGGFMGVSNSNRSN